MTRTIAQSIRQVIPPLSSFPRRALESSEVPRFLSAEACEALFARVRAFRTGSGRTETDVRSQWAADVRWARNRLWIASDRQNTTIRIGCGSGSVDTNVWDDASLQAAVRMAERENQMAGQMESLEIPPPRATMTYSTPTIWSDATYAQPAETRNAVVQRIVASAEQAGMLSAGYVNVLARGHSIRRSEGLALYAPQTIAQCSMTVRDPEGSGSGWAGASSYDWARFNPDTLAAIALDKCLRSRHPVAIEPGRYTVILEPQATFEFASPLIGQGIEWGRDGSESGPGRMSSPYFDRDDSVTPDPAGSSVRLGFSRMGQQVVDTRISISHDPMDPQLGVVPFDDRGEPYHAVAWFDQGVLANLPTDLEYGLKKLKSGQYYPNSGAFRMSGGTTSIEEMIATTKRGVLVTRFSHIQRLDRKSMLMTGLTRDGLWLIENGKISKAVKNFRFTESPLFVFNNVEQLGIPVPVFSPDAPAIVPPVKVRDFSFTSLIDAV